MIIKILCAVCILLIISCKVNLHNGILITENKAEVSIENQYLRVIYNLDRGTYIAIDKTDNTLAIFNAHSSINDLSSNNQGVINTYKALNINDKLGSGASILIRGKKNNQPDLLTKFTLYADRNSLFVSGGVNNSMDTSFRIHSIAPVDSASIFRDLDMSSNFRLIDGNDGGLATYIRKNPTLECYNNLILSFGDNNHYHSMVAGGISYKEFAKFVKLGEPLQRAKDLYQNGVEGKPVIFYCDLGEPDQAKGNAENTREYIKSPLVFSTIAEFAPGYQEAKSMVFSNRQLAFDLINLSNNKEYSVGITCCDDGKGRIQSFWIEYDGILKKMSPATRLPSIPKGEKLNTVFFAIPKEAVKAKRLQVIVQKEEGLNAVASEMMLLQGTLNKKVDYVSGQGDFKNPALKLYAKDDIGKLVDAGKTYLPENDVFYIDFVTENPIESAEKYGSTLKESQDVKLNYYYFPTVCLWYAMDPRYGGNVIMGTNDSPGAVGEMNRVKSSGFLKYTTVGIRLVPDCYEKSNENGWWDDAHWQMHGSGVQHPGMKLQGSHYRIPYETTEKWAQAVIQLGGIPFMYFQTAVRSNDYAEKYPKQMLFNESYQKVAVNYAINGGYSTYDFTDKDFVAHMREVYRNLKDGGVKGLMFDYPFSGWNDYGGMDDKYMTTIGGYRKIFELAHEGLGENSWIQERNIKHGSDATVGLVESQRTWRDTDDLTSEMVMRTGLRWYKNRVVINYDMDAKNLLKAKPADSRDGLNKLLTMSYVTASRLLLANSFGVLDSCHIYKLSRIFPFHSKPQSAQPLDAFVSDYPRVYGFRVDEKWYQLTFYNEDNDAPKSVAIEISGIAGFGGAGLNSGKVYHAYDFWNDTYLGQFKGTEKLVQNLRKGEARMLSVREVESHPQVLSTDRHIMQGMLELSGIVWNKGQRTLSGNASIIASEPMNIALALNGYKALSVKSQAAKVSIIKVNGDLIKLQISDSHNKNADWQITFN